MENEILLETNNPYFSRSLLMPIPDFTVKPEDYTYVDNREKGTVSFASVSESVEKLREAMKVVDGVLFNDMKNSLLDLKLTYDEYKRYMYATASNNQLKRHGLPMRRKVKK